MASRYKDPIPTHISKAAVEGFAEKTASEFDFEPGDLIENIVSQLGGEILFSNPVGEEFPESIRVEPDLSFRIFLSSLTSASRDRFTVAHELGHFFLHFPLVKEQHPGFGMRATRWVDESNKDLQRCEWEANWFAAAFLMPKSPFIKACGSMTIQDVASQFGVSEKAAQVRARSLNVSVN